MAEAGDFETEHRRLDLLGNVDRRVSERYPWYDSWWLAEYVEAKEVLGRERPDLLPSFEDSFAVFRTSLDFETRVFPALLDGAQLDEIRNEISAVDDADTEQHEIEAFGRLLLHNHEYFDAMHESFVELVSEAVGEPVEPSYNFLSLYRSEAACGLHLDAPCAKWTLDLCIDQSETWPIHISNVVPWPEEFGARDDWPRAIVESPGIAFRSHAMEPGDALVFSGSSQWHYRDQQPGGPHGFCDLMFFHFVPEGTRKLRPSSWGPLALEPVESEPDPPGAPDPVVPRPDPRGFRRELTPTWLHAATLLSGHRPPDLSRPFRAAYLGCGTGQTPAVVAAVHPDCEVWGWDFRLDQVEATRRLRDAAALDNLIVHERPGLPSDLGGAPCDLIVVAGVLDVVDDIMRNDVIAAVGANLRPGGVVCVTYRTTVGWSEISPVQRLMRSVAQRDTGDPEGVVDRVLDLLADLREGGAGYIVHRPIVAAWLAEEVFGGDPAVVSAEYLGDDLRPVSHAQLVEWLEPSGLAYVGSARITDDLDLDVNEDLRQMIDAAPSSLVREAYRDIAVRRATRADVFRMGAAPLTNQERRLLLDGLDVVDTAVAERNEVSLRLAFASGTSHPASVSGHVAATRSDASDALGIEVLIERGSAR